jgi:hypothetical protein
MPDLSDGDLRSGAQQVLAARDQIENVTHLLNYELLQAVAGSGFDIAEKVVVLEELRAGIGRTAERLKPDNATYSTIALMVVPVSIADRLIQHIEEVEATRSVDVRELVDLVALTIESHSEYGAAVDLALRERLDVLTARTSRTRWFVLDFLLVQLSVASLVWWQVKRRQRRDPLSAAPDFPGQHVRKRSSLSRQGVGKS